MVHPVRYTLTPASPEAHLFHITCRVAAPDPAGQRFTLPTWIPGSYLIREFARQVVSIQAQADGKQVALTKLDKHSWQAAPVKPGRALEVSYQVYAWDLSVRGAHLDRNHAYFNGPSVFLSVVGQEHLPCRVELAPPAGKAYQDWRVATAMRPAKGEKGAAKRWGFGLYEAADYDELLDHPVEMGHFDVVEFKACGTPHAVAVTGRHDGDLERLAKDLKPICESHIRLFAKTAPMDRYLFLVTVVGKGYGGLEHRASTSLLASRNDLPGAQTPTEGPLPDSYVNFLGLCSHEYFHSWNVKRIKPAAFIPYDLDREAHTHLLWAFEGFTSYYDDLGLLRSGRIDAKTYLKLLGKTAERVRQAPGRLKQSVADSSFDTWIKAYRPDENTPNAVVNYYTQGALIALGLDLELRRGSHGRKSLDQVMQVLWQRYGQSGTGVGEGDIFTAVAEVGGPTAARWLEKAVTTPGDVALEKPLKALGVKLQWQPLGDKPSLGVRTTVEGGDLKLATVFSGGPAERAGLAGGDVLVAWNGLRISPDGLDELLARHRAGDDIQLHYFRRDELQETHLVLAPPPAHRAELRLMEGLPESTGRLRRGWLGE